MLCSRLSQLAYVSYQSNKHIYRLLPGSLVIRGVEDISVQTRKKEGNSNSSLSIAVFQRTQLGHRNPYAYTVLLRSGLLSPIFCLINERKGKNKENQAKKNLKIMVHILVNKQDKACTVPHVPKPRGRSNWKAEQVLSRVVPLTHTTIKEL